MRRYLYLFSFVAVLGSCKKYLVQTPNNALSNSSAIVDAGTANAAIAGTYSALAAYYSGSNASYPTLGTMPADNVIFNGTLSQYLQLDQNAIPPDNVTTVATYQGIYKTINTANSVIAAVPGVKDPTLTATQKNIILGEAYFIRALGYFDLGRGWGGVQLQLKPTTDIGSIKGVQRSSLADTYAQVAADLIISEQLLADTAIRNRASKGAARALHARLALYQQNWDSAEFYASEVIASPKYVLVTPYSKFFATPFLSTESVFELTYTNSSKNSFWNLWYPSSLGGQYTLKPSASIIARLNDPAAGGSRKAVLAGSGASVYGVLYNTSTSSTDPNYVIRIAELYLIRAEARAQKGNLAGALADLNVIRARAGVAASTASSPADVLQAIEDENSVEFAFEAHRWFDLVRTKRAGAVLRLTNTNYWLFPLPLSDVLSDPDLGGKNNPGY
jgi:hypothetical protein